MADLGLFLICWSEKDTCSLEEGVLGNHPTPEQMEEQSKAFHGEDY